MSNTSIQHKSFVCIQIKCQTVLFDRTQSGATTLDQRGTRSDSNKEVLQIPQSSSITGASLSYCLLSYTGHLLREFYSSAEMQLVYSTTLSDWALKETRQESLIPLLRCSRCILQPLSTMPSRTLAGRVLSLCKDAVGVFYNPSRLGHRGHSLGESYPSAEMQSVYSTALVDYAIKDTRWESPFPLQRCSRCILQPQSPGPSRTLVGRVLSLCRDAIDVLPIGPSNIFDGICTQETYQACHSKQRPNS